MSHEILNNAIAYTNETPWHGLGTRMPEDNQNLDQWRVAAGLDWFADRAPIQFKNGENVVEVPDRHALFRSDNGMFLGVVSPKYKPVQPRDVLDFYGDLTERHGFKMEVAGALRGGKVIWGLAKTGVGTRIMGQDAVDCYLLLATGFDTVMATRAFFTATRVVCNNTIQIAFENGAATGKKVSVSHHSTFDPTKVKMELGVGDAFAAWNAKAEALAAREVTPEEQVKFLLSVYHNVTDLGSDVAKSKMAERTMERMAGILANAPGQQFRSALNTAWGLVNAVTYDVDHSQRARSDDARLNSAWFGTGNQLKTKAWDTGLKLLKAA